MTATVSLPSDDTSSRPPGLWWHGSLIRAALFDVDGTLYRQSPVRARMALELLKHFLSHPLTARRQIRALRAFRDAQEMLRGGSDTVGVAHRQLEVAAAQTGIDMGELTGVVDDWMYQRPLAFLRGRAAEGLEPLLTLFETHAVRLGVLSDYPAEGKLRALGLADRFPVVVSATHPDVGVFKPHPRGFLVAANLLGVAPPEVLMIGDRVDADAEGAAAAGMSCVIVGTHDTGAVPAGTTIVPSFERLACDLATGR